MTSPENPGDLAAFGAEQSMELIPESGLPDGGVAATPWARLASFASTTKGKVVLAGAAAVVGGLAVAAWPRRG